MSSDTPNVRKNSWLNVTRVDPCRICGKTDWCSRSEDGTLEVCYRVQRADAVVKTNKIGQEFFCYYSGAKGDDRRQEAEELLTEERADVPAASDDVLDAVYRAILAACPLTELHRAFLHGKGLSDADITADLYASWPADEFTQRRTMNTIFRQFDRETMVKVPGVYVADRQETKEQLEARIDAGGYPGPVRDGALACGPGILHPICNRDGQIVAMQVRGEDGDYTWLSSVRHGGPGRRPALHFPPAAARPITATTVRLVESIRAANMATRATGILTVATATVGGWPLLVGEARDIGVEQVIIANDADVREKKGVSGATRRCADVLTREGYGVSIERWDPRHGKGLDDVIAAGHLDAVEQLTGAALWRYVRDFLRSSGAPKDATTEARLVVASMLERLPKEPATASRQEVYSAVAVLDESSVEYQCVIQTVKMALRGGFTAWRKAVDATRKKLKATNRIEDETRQGRAVIEFDDHVTIKNAVLQRLGGQADDRLIADEGEFYRYDGLGYAVVPVREIDEAVQAFSQALVTSKNTRLHVNHSTVEGVRSLLHGTLLRKGFFADAPRGIAFRDKFVRVDKSCVVVEPVGKHHRARARYDFDYQPGAVPVETLKALRAMWMYRGDDGQWRPEPDAEENIQCVREFTGVTFLGAAPRFKTALWGFSKESDTGKSTVGLLIEKMAPAGSVAHVSPLQWRDPQSLAQLAGKLFNFADEMPVKGMFDGACFKRVLNGIGQQVKVVYAPPFDIFPIAGHYMSANGLMRPDEHGDAVFDKIIPIQFRRKFLRHVDMEIGLVDRLVESEKAAFVSWAIDGAVEAFKRKAITIPSSSLALRQRWQNDSSAVRQWLGERFSIVPVDEIVDDGDELKLPELDVLYENYRRWYDESYADPRRALGKQQLSSELADMGILYRTRFTRTTGLHRYRLNFGGSAEKAKTDGEDAYRTFMNAQVGSA